MHYIRYSFKDVRVGAIIEIADFHSQIRRSDEAFPGANGYVFSTGSAGQVPACNLCRLVRHIRRGLAHGARKYLGIQQGWNIVEMEAIGYAHKAKIVVGR